MPATRLEKSKTTRKVSLASAKEKKVEAAPAPKLKSIRGRPKVQLAKEANALSSNELQSVLAEYLGEPISNEEGSGEFVWKVYSGPELENSPQRDRVWSLFETNMHDIYIEANDTYLKWDPVDKKKELYDKKSRYVLLESKDQSELAAFCMFRFEADKNIKGVMEFLIYLYEFQVQKKFQGMGIARRVLEALEDVGAEYGVQLIMLTCFRCNVKAVPVYRHFGYKDHVDTTDNAWVFFKKLK